MMSSEDMRDSEFAKNIPTSWRGIVAGYFGGPGAAHVWAKDTEWGRFRKNKKLPIWVAGFSHQDGLTEAGQAVESLYFLGATKGCFVALDMETQVDKTYVDAFTGVMAYAGFPCFVYGSASTVFSNPQGAGYWVADYRGIGPFMYQPPAGKLVRATQYADPAGGSGGNWDSSSVKFWTKTRGKWWV